MTRREALAWVNARESDEAGDVADALVALLEIQHDRVLEEAVKALGTQQQGFPRGGKTRPWENNEVTSRWPTTYQKREPLIVRVPTALSLVLKQVDDERVRRDHLDRFVQVFVRVNKVWTRCSPVSVTWQWGTGANRSRQVGGIGGAQYHATADGKKSVCGYSSIVGDGPEIYDASDDELSCEACQERVRRVAHDVGERRRRAQRLAFERAWR
jgi:hypothetical protein